MHLGNSIPPFHQNPTPQEGVLCKESYYIESGKVFFILQCMFLISAGNEHEYFPHIPFEFIVANGFQVNGSEVVIVWFVGFGLEVIEILIPLLLCRQMSLPCRTRLYQTPSALTVTPTASCAGLCL